MENLIKYDLLKECESKLNTLTLPVKKENGKVYQVVQDLKAINEIVEDIYLVAVNPYTLLTTLTEK